jgi:radical SAM protein with 4Fe4S-binding SPASM domain
MSVGTLSYGDFSRELHGKILAQRAPVDGTIEITRRCPLTCSHCYNNLPMGDHTARKRELSLEEYRRILDEIADAGCLWLLFTGGEIFARADFLDIYAYAKRKGFIITLFTNATLITPKIADYLAEWRPFAIEVTLYGHTKETYERLTGIPGSFERCRRGVELLLERGLPLKLKTVGTTITKPEVFAMRDFAESLGVEFKFDSMINPRIDCSQSPLEVRLTPEEVVELDLQDPRRMPEWESMNNRYRRVVASHAASSFANTVYSCGGGVSGFAISPYGEMSICVLSQVDRYDLRRGSFRDGWEQFLRKVRFQERTLPVKCTSCEIRAMCTNCAAVSELENGHKEKPVDFFCRTNHLRAYLLDIPLKPNPLCEYRPGSEKYEDIQASVEALRKKAQELGHWSPPKTDGRALPVLGAPASGGGSCSTCG